MKWLKRGGGSIFQNQKLVDEKQQLWCSAAHKRSYYIMNTKNPHSASKAGHFSGTCNFIGLLEG